MWTMAFICHKLLKMLLIALHSCPAQKFTSPRCGKKKLPNLKDVLQALEQVLAD